MLGRRTDAAEEGLRALSDKLDKMEAERKSLYSMIDKLTGYIEETNRRFDNLVEQVEVLENRITDCELYLDKIRKEEINDDGGQNDVSGDS